MPLTEVQKAQLLILLRDVGAAELHEAVREHFFWVNLLLEEGERQALLMALAHLSIERPGWDDMLNRIAVRIDHVEGGRAKMFDEFRQLKVKS